jgi:hypothetical protein
MAQKKEEEKQNKDASSKEDEIVKEARSKVLRFLKKQLVKALPFNKTAPHRLEIVNIITDCKRATQDLMNALEQGFNSDEVLKKLTEVKQIFDSVRRPLATLNVMHKSDYYSSKEKQQMEKHKGKEPMDDPFLDWLTKRRVRRDISEELF